MSNGVSEGLWHNLSLDVVESMMRPETPSKVRKKRERQQDTKRVSWKHANVR